MNQKLARASKTLQLTTLGIGCLATAFGLAAQDPEAGPYLHGGVGFAMAEDSRVMEFPAGVTAGDLTFDTGVAVSVAGGYNFNRWLAAEFETGFLLNGIERLGDAGFYGDAALYQTPIMGNVLFQYRNPSGVVPFVGAGAGGSLQIFAADRLRTGSVYLDGADSDFVFAWQVMAGVKYEFSRHMGAGLTYRYRDTEAPKWDVSESFSNLRVAFDRIKTHSIMAEFHYRF